jgi:hypothetical protein
MRCRRYDTTSTVLFVGGCGGSSNLRSVLCASGNLSPCRSLQPSVHVVHCIPLTMSFPSPPVHFVHPHPLFMSFMTFTAPLFVSFASVHVVPSHATSRCDPGDPGDHWCDRGACSDLCDLAQAGVAGGYKRYKAVAPGRVITCHQRSERLGAMPSVSSCIRLPPTLCSFRSCMAP